jgi:ribosomal protein S18 acetylase RimI-like enzyme
MCELAVERDCELVWLGTEPDNTAANALYKSLEPDEVENFTGYCFELD